MELSPCPLCGGAARVLEAESGFRVGCELNFCVNLTNWFQSAASAGEFWNRRPYHVSLLRPMLDEVKRLEVRNLKAS